MVVESDRNMSLCWNEKSYCVRRTARDLFLNVRMKCFVNYRFAVYIERRSQWPRTLSRRSAAARLLGLWVRIPPGAWMFVCCECRVFSGRGLCDGLITRPEESYRLCCVVVCDPETSFIKKSWPTGCCSAKKNKPLTASQNALAFQPAGPDGYSTASFLNDVTTVLRLRASIYIVCLFFAQQPPVDQDLLIHEVSRSHTTTQHSR